MAKLKQLAKFLFAPPEVNTQDRVFYFGLKGLCYLVLALFLFLLKFLYDSSKPTFEAFGWKFFIGQQWSPNNGIFGAFPFIYGTLLTSMLAIILSVPISVATAVYLTEMAPEWIRRPLGYLVEMLAAIPSVIYGLWGISVLAPFVRDQIQKPLANIFHDSMFFEGPPLGLGVLSAGIVLAIMIIPTITSITREVLRSIPDTLREGALALGATKSEMIHTSVIKTGLSGIGGAVMLGIGRAVGETMAVTMIIGNRPTISPSLFSPASTMASVIANEYGEASDPLHLSSLSAIGLTLFAISFFINFLARVIVRRVKREAKGFAT